MPAASVKRSCIKAQVQAAVFRVAVDGGVISTKLKWVAVAAIITAGGLYVYGQRAAAPGIPGDLRDAVADNAMDALSETAGAPDMAVPAVSAPVTVQKGTSVPQKTPVDEITEVRNDILRMNRTINLGQLRIQSALLRVQMDSYDPLFDLELSAVSLEWCHLTGIDAVALSARTKKLRKFAYRSQEQNKLFREMERSARTLLSAIQSSRLLLSQFSLVKPTNANVALLITHNARLSIQAQALLLDCKTLVLESQP